MEPVVGQGPFCREYTTRVNYKLLMTIDNGKFGMMD